MPTRLLACRGAKSEIAGREIEFLVVKRVVGDVHLAITAQQRAVGVDNGRGVVIDAGARFSKREAISTTPCCLAAAESFSVVGPGMGSASSNSA